MQTATQKLSVAAHIELGARGENLAAEYLQAQGMDIIARNWRIRAGELDIIAQDGETLVAVEVKTRSGTGYGTGFEAINRQKISKLRMLTAMWLAENELFFESVRIDAVSVLARPGRTPEIAHLRGVV